MVFHAAKRCLLVIALLYPSSIPNRSALNMTRMTASVGVALVLSGGAALILRQTGWNNPIENVKEMLRHPAKLVVAAEHPTQGNVSAGREFFAKKCSDCHMVNGEGGSIGPDLSRIARERSLEHIRAVLANPNAFRNPAYRLVSVRLRDGREVRGYPRNESTFDLQLHTLEG